jgi:hypothetical protein
LQNAHEQTGLRLDTLHGRDDKDDAIEDAQNSLHLGDEVGLTGRVDQVDDHVLDQERNHRRLDGDPRPAHRLAGPRFSQGHLFDEDVAIGVS